MRSERFETPGYVRLDVDNECGSVEVVAGETAATEIELSSDRGGSELVEGTRISVRPAHGGSAVAVAVPHRKHRFLRGEDVRVTVRVPLGTELGVRTASADVDAAGVFGNVEVETASGDVDLDEGAEVRLRSASGNLRVGAAQSLNARSASGEVLAGRVAGRASMQTTSGGVRLGGADSEVKVETVSGTLTVDLAERGVTAKSVSGDVRVWCVADGDVVLQTVSGDASVGVAPGRAVEVDAQSLSGRLSSEIELDGAPSGLGGPAGRVRIKFNSVSGDLRLSRAAPPSPPTSRKAEDEPGRRAGAPAAPEAPTGPAPADAGLPAGPAGADPPPPPVAGA
jgi:hypothetical protein